MIEVLREHFTVEKKTQFGTVHRSLGMDKVYVKNEEGLWRHCGYLAHAAKAFMPLVGVPNELVPLIAAECRKQIEAEVSFVMAPQLDEPIDGDEDES